MNTEAAVKPREPETGDDPAAANAPTSVPKSNARERPNPAEGAMAGSKESLSRPTVYKARRQVAAAEKGDIAKTAERSEPRGFAAVLLEEEAVEDAAEDAAAKRETRLPPVGVLNAGLVQPRRWVLNEDEEEPAGDVAAKCETRLLPVGALRPAHLQPRRKFPKEDLEALAASIREKGVLQSVLVRPVAELQGAYEIVVGERRWRAAQLAGLQEIPATVRELSDRESLEVALVENLQRQDLSPLEEAAGYRRLMDEFRHTQDTLAEAVGKSRSHVANMLRLLGLPEPIKEMLDGGRLSAGHARALLNAPDKNAIARKVIGNQLSVRETERLAHLAQQPKTSPRRRTAKSAELVPLERRLSDLLGLRVSFNERRGYCELVIRYNELPQLDEMLAALGCRRTDESLAVAATCPKPDSE